MGIVVSRIREKQNKQTKREKERKKISNTKSKGESCSFFFGGGGWEVGWEGNNAKTSSLREKPKGRGKQAQFYYSTLNSSAEIHKEQWIHQC